MRFFEHDYNSRDNSHGSGEERESDRRETSADRRPPFHHGPVPLPPHIGPDRFRGPKSMMLDRDLFEKHYSSLSREEKISFMIAHLFRLMGRVPGAVYGQGKVLSLLTAGGEMTQKELTDRAGIQPGSMSEVLKKLETGGYIRRMPDPRDGRGSIICLTEAGMIAARQTVDGAGEVYSGLTDEEKDNLLTLMEKLEASWREKLPKPPMQGLFAEKPQKA